MDFEPDFRAAATGWIGVVHERKVFAAQAAGSRIEGVTRGARKMLLQRIDLAYGHRRGCAGEHFNSAALNERAKACFFALAQRPLSSTVAAGYQNRPSNIWRGREADHAARQHLDCENFFRHELSGPDELE
jgi:hypothetical protein